MSDRPRGTIPARLPQPQLLLRAELERIRCAARSGIADPADLLAVLDQVDVRDRVIHEIAARVQDDPEESARVARAREAVDENPPMHVRIEFDCSGPSRTMGLQTWLDVVREWSPAEVASLATGGAQVTVTYRLQTETWRATAP